MPESVPMLADILHLPGEKEKGSERARQDLQRFKDRIAQEIKKVHSVASMPKLFDCISTMLGIPLPDIMVKAWEKGDEIARVLRDSAALPDDEFTVELGEHELATEFKPQIEIRLAKLPPIELDFLITLSLELKEIVLTIMKGRILKIRTGSCQAGGELHFHDLLLAERKLEPFQLPGEISLQ